MDGDRDIDVGPCDGNGGTVLVITTIVVDGVSADVSSTGTEDIVPADNVVVGRSLVSIVVGRSLVPIGGSSVRAKDTLRGSIEAGSVEIDTRVGDWEGCDVTAKS